VLESAARNFLASWEETSSDLVPKVLGEEETCFLAGVAGLESASQWESLCLGARVPSNLEEVGVMVALRDQEVVGKESGSSVREKMLDNSV
jgi:hypothetical protein